MDERDVAQDYDHGSAVQDPRVGFKIHFDKVVSCSFPVHTPVVIHNLVCSPHSKRQSHEIIRCKSSEHVCERGRNKDSQRRHVMNHLDRRDKIKRNSKREPKEGRKQPNSQWNQGQPKHNPACPCQLQRILPHFPPMNNRGHRLVNRLVPPQRIDHLRLISEQQLDLLEVEAQELYIVVDLQLCHICGEPGIGASLGEVPSV